MRKFAILSNNIVTETVDLEEISVAEKASKCEMLIDIEDISPQPQIGWTLVGNTLSPSSAIPLEQLIRAKIKKAREFGTKLSGDATDRIGAKNVLSGKTEGQVLGIASALQPIRQLLEGGALATARAQLLLVRPSLDEVLQGELDWAVQQLTAYLEN